MKLGGGIRIVILPLNGIQMEAFLFLTLYFSEESPLPPKIMNILSLKSEV